MMTNTGEVWEIQLSSGRYIVVTLEEHENVMVAIVLEAPTDKLHQVGTTQMWVKSVFGSEGVTRIA